MAAALRLEIVHTDPRGVLDVYEFKQGQPAMVEVLPHLPWRDGWWVDGQRVGRQRVRVERGGHQFTLRLAPPLSRIPKEPARFQPWIANALVLALLAGTGLSLLSSQAVVLLEAPSRCGFGGHLIVEPVPEMGPVSYVPRQQPAPAALPLTGLAPGGVAPRRAPNANGQPNGVGQSPAKGPGGHPLALQVDQWVLDQREELALCYRSSGVAGHRRQGQLDVLGAVGPEGHVTQLRIGRDDFRNDPLATCVLSVFEDLLVPGPPETVTIRYPVRFSLPG